MRFGDILIVFSVVALIAVAGYVLYEELNQTYVPYNEFGSVIKTDFSYNELQFYPNMRFRDKEIPFNIQSDCDDGKKADILDAISILESKVIIKFVESSKGGISYSCSGNPEEFGLEDTKNHIVAGYYEPDDILNLSNFFLIENANIHLISPEKCKNPNVAIHETLHALGFDHVDKESSIMYPITRCDQEIDNSIIAEINRIYEIPNKPDIVIEKISANKTGRYLNFVINIANYGLADADNVALEIVLDGEKIKDYTFKTIQIGKRTELSIMNLRAPKAGDLLFRINMTQEDLNPENNFARISPVAVSG